MQPPLPSILKIISTFSLPLQSMVDLDALGLYSFLFSFRDIYMVGEMTQQLKLSTNLSPPEFSLQLPIIQITTAYNSTSRWSNISGFCSTCTQVHLHLCAHIHTQIYIHTHYTRIRTQNSVVRPIIPTFRWQSQEDHPQVLDHLVHTVSRVSFRLVGALQKYHVSNNNSKGKYIRKYFGYKYFILTIPIYYNHFHRLLYLKPHF